MTEIFEKVPFSWTIACSIVVYPLGLPLFANAVTSESRILAVTVLFGILGALINICTFIFLFRTIEEVRHIKRSSIFFMIFKIIDVWLALVTAQTVVLYIPYMFDQAMAFDGIGAENGPWYVYAKLFYVICDNFHGASSTGVVARSITAILWLTVSSLVARIFFFIAVPLIFALIGKELLLKKYEKIDTKIKF